MLKSSRPNPVSPLTPGGIICLFDLCNWDLIDLVRGFQCGVGHVCMVEFLIPPRGLVFIGVHHYLREEME